MKKTVLLAVVASVLTGTPGVRAEPPTGQVPRLFGMFQAKPGAWAEYSIKEKDTGKSYKMKMAIVGREGDAHWYEVTNDEGDSRNVIKMLVKGNPNDPENIQRQIIKSGDNPAMEMHRDFVVMGRRMAALMFERRSGVSASASAVKVESLGDKEITLPAGTFKISEQRILDGEGKVLATYGYNAGVLPFGVVYSSTDTTQMELLANGMDAKSVITEEPALMTSPRGMPAGMPRGYPPGMEKQGK